MIHNATDETDLSSRPPKSKPMPAVILNGSKNIKTEIHGLRVGTKFNINWHIQITFGEAVIYRQKIRNKVMCIYKNQRY